MEVEKAHKHSRRVSQHTLNSCIQQPNGKKELNTENTMTTHTPCSLLLDNGLTSLISAGQIKGLCWTFTG